MGAGIDAVRHVQVAVHLMVEQSRRACSAVANGEADCAIIGGDVPDELAHVLKVGSRPSGGRLHLLIHPLSQKLPSKGGGQSAI